MNEDLHGLELSPTKRLAAAAMAARCAAILYPVAAAIENPEASGHPCRFFSRFLHLALLFWNHTWNKRHSRSFANRKFLISISVNYICQIIWETNVMIFLCLRAIEIEHICLKEIRKWFRVNFIWTYKLVVSLWMRCGRNYKWSCYSCSNFTI